MQTLTHNVKDHYITFKDPNQTDSKGKPIARTIYMTREDFEPISNAIKAGRSDLYVRPLGRFIPKRSYEEAGVLTDSQLRALREKRSFNEVRIYCGSCDYSAPENKFFKTHGFTFCRDRRERMLQKNNQQN